MCSAVSLEPRHRPEMSPDNPNDAVIHNTHHYDEDDTSCDLVYKQTNGIDSIIVDNQCISDLPAVQRSAIFIKIDEKIKLFLTK